MAPLRHGALPDQQDIRLVQEALGHSSPNVTAVYAALDVSQTAGAMMAPVEEVS